MKFKKLLVLFSLFIFSTQVTLAGNRANVTTLTLSDSLYTFASKRKLDNTGVPNISLTYNFNDRWGGEALFGIVNTDQKRSIGGEHVHGYLALVDGLYRFNTWGKWEPYASAGIGMLGLKPNGDSSRYAGNINAGLGTQAFVHENLAFRGEVKDIYTFAGGKNDVMMNLGFSILFGGGEEKLNAK